MNGDGELPEGWASAGIRSVFDCWGGMTPSTTVDTYWGGTMPWISSKDVKGWTVDGGTECITEKAMRETRLRECPVGSVLVVVRSGVLAHTLPVAVTTRSVVVNQDLKALSSGNSDLNAWLAVYLRAHEREILESNRKDGTTVQSIRVEELLGRELPVPPLAEQHRIVEKVEALLAQVNKAKDRLDRVTMILKRFRQAVLAAACSGRLTEEWIGRRSETEAEVASIRAEILRLKNAVPGARRKRKAEPQVPDALPETIPDHWTTCRIGDVFDVTYGLSEPLRKTVPDSKDDLPVLSMANINQWGEWNLAVLKYFPVPPQSRSKLRLEVGDLLFNWRNSPNWIGKTARFDMSDGVYVNASFLLRLRPSRPGTYEKFFRLYLNFLRVSRYFESASRAAVSQSNFNASEVGAIEVPFPPLHEQGEIARRVEKMFGLADAIETRLISAARRAEKLPQSILSKAFRGELVPTEAELARAEGRSFETAEEMLKRVKMENGSETEKGTRARRRRTS